MDFVLKFVYLLFLLSSSSQDDAPSIHDRSNWWAKRDTEDIETAYNETEELGKTFDVGKSYGDYSYAECEGSLTWPDIYPSCNGARQSPININLPTALHLSEEYNLIFKGHDLLPNKMVLKNTGKTVVIKPTWANDKRPTIKGGVLEGEYIFHEIHFHWGATIFEPSEHLINGYSFPLEMHVVYYKKKYGSLKNAKDHNDGLAVVGYVFEVGHHDSPVLQRIIDKIPNIQNTASPPVELTPFKISTLAPVFKSDFATYLGSLTMPPCNEIVTWIVYLKPLKANCDQVKQFRLIQDHHGKLIKRNFRPTQRLNGRKVFLVSKYYFY